jgi:hypothetical protein
MRGRSRDVAVDHIVEIERNSTEFIIMINDTLILFLTLAHHHRWTSTPCSFDAKSGMVTNWTLSPSSWDETRDALPSRTNSTQHETGDVGETLCGYSQHHFTDFSEKGRIATRGLLGLHLL